MQKTKKRLKFSLSIFFLVAALLITRLVYIQLICGDELTEMASSQYKMRIEGLDARGMILDRNFKPLTGGNKTYYYVIGKSKSLREIEEKIANSGLCQVAAEKSAYYVFKSESYNADVGKSLKENFDAYIFETDTRYTDEQPACHLVGYINEDQCKGVSGLELMYDEKLFFKGDTLNLWADASGGLLKGYAPSLYISKDTKTMDQCLVTTIDRRVQHVCEKALAETDKRGAVLVADDNGEIIAWASSPTFNPNNVTVHLNDVDTCLVDRVSQGTYAPGSVFKIVTAAAALESGMKDEEDEYICKGSVTIEGVTVNCSTGGEKGHGKIDMKRAMAESCNCYFVQLGKDIGSDKIVEMASRMGLGQKCFDSFPGEKSGNLPLKEELSPRDITNLSIGQGSLLVTPLQMSRVTSIIANGGLPVEFKLIGGNEKEEQQRVISEETAGKIDEMLKLVMTTGTARMDWSLPVRGKTGTAEAVTEGKKTNNCFFSGYFRLKDKTYVVTVLVEDGVTGGTDAVPVFETIHNFFADNL